MTTIPLERSDKRAWHARAVVVAAVCIMVGIYWDISWHMSIGRDSFWTPAHLLIQAGGLIAGITSGMVALRTTFRGTEADRSATVGMWGFRAPLGAWVCVWGCIAMVASAPFDNWWHDAYGLDVKIVSPPHAILALGIYAIMWGALLLTLAKQNQSEAGSPAQRRFGRLYLVVGALLLMNNSIFLTEYSDRVLQHGGEFYRATMIVYPFSLVAVAWGSKHRWAATLAAVAYMAIMLTLMWIIQLFPATPKLGPIFHPITRMVALDFPMLLIVPGLFVDLLRRALAERVPRLVLALALGSAVLAGVLVTQWPFSTFLVESPAARGWFFNADNFVYWASPRFVSRSHSFAGWPVATALDLALAWVIAAVSAMVGLAGGGWLARVQR